MELGDSSCLAEKERASYRQLKYWNRRTLMEKRDLIGKQAL